VAIGATIALSLGAAGCQPYERRPLDLDTARDRWLARDPGDESARQFALHLARAEQRGDAAPFHAGDGLTLAEAEAVALVFNRDLRLARLEANVTRARADTAGLWDDPVAGVDLERIVSGVAEPWVLGATLELTIPISGRLAVEKTRAGAAHAAELQWLAAREWATRTALREHWIEWSAQAHRAELLGELVEHLGGVVDLTQRQERAGTISRIEARLYRFELAVGEADLLATRSRERQSRLQLLDLLGLAPEAPVELAATVAFAARGARMQWPREAFEAGSIELAAARSEYELAEQTLHLAVRQQYPDLVIGPGFGTDQGDDRVLLGVRVPLPLWNRNRQGVAEATAQREVARGRFEGAYERLASQLALGRIRHEAARALRQAIESHVLPLADEQDAEVRRVAELGRVDPLLRLQAMKSQYEARLRLVEARAAESIEAIRLDALIGPSAPDPSAPDPSAPDPSAPDPSAPDPSAIDSPADSPGAPPSGGRP
jgi:cobalt-zinc-cadmium efflux system outer membrane protein